MNNIITDIGHGIKVAAIDTEHIIVEGVEFLPRAIKVLDTAIADQHQVKAVVIELVKRSMGVIGDFSTAVASKGLNLAQDSAALADAEAYFQWFRDTFCPVIESVYHEVAQDLK